MAEVLAEIFAVGVLEADTPQEALYKELEEIHMQVRDDQIERIFELIAAHKLQRPQLLYALQYIAKVCWG